VYEFQKGVASKELVDCGEPVEDVKALFMGAAGGCVPYDPKLKLDCEALKSKGCMLGSCTVIVAGSSRKIPEVCKNIAEFFVHESCGKCTPCREGTFRILQLLNKLLNWKGSEKDLATLEDLCGFVEKASFCGLGRTATLHLSTALKYFREEFEELCK